MYMNNYVALQYVYAYKIQNSTYKNRQFVGIGNYVQLIIASDAVSQ